MPVPSPRRRLAVTLLAALPWPVVLFQFLVTLPRYDKMFRDFGLHLDDFTAMVLNVSMWLRRNFLIAFAATFFLMAVSLLTAYMVQSAEMSRNRRAAILLFVFGVPCLVFALSWLGVVDTHSRLVEGLKK